MISLGIDTGGTYTDAVLYHKDKGVYAKSKSPTTRENLTIGIENAINSVIDEYVRTENSQPEISLVSLSTTLATNAIVEGHGGRVCLMLIGPLDDALGRANLSDAIGSDPVVRITGGHDAQGEELNELDETAVLNAVKEFNNSVNAFAVAGHFATRNSSHEKRARRLIEEHSQKPVTCSIDLSARLDAPRRALTSVLNARLIPLIYDLVVAVQSIMETRKLSAPLMIMQGDGSLLRADQATRKPVETILSGPAASIIGAAKIADVKEGLISDIGGTTTDIAIIHDGLPQRDSDGCVVAGWKTMVEAVKVYTFGLGGDSEVHIKNHREIQLGPQRAIPIGMLASQYPKIERVLKNQLERAAREYDGYFAFRYRVLPDGFRLTPREQTLWDRLADGPVDLDTLLENAALERPLKKLRQLGWVAISTLTPTDASQYLKVHSQWHQPSVDLAVRLILRRFIMDSPNPEAFAKLIVDQLIKQSARRCFEAAWLDDGHDEKTIISPTILDGAFNDAENDENSRASRVKFGLNLMLVAIGAPAKAYYNNVAELLTTDVNIPQHYDVCNAIGAVVSGIVRRREALINIVGDRVYRLHLYDIVKQSDNIEELDVFARQKLEQLVTEEVQENGAENISVEFQSKESEVISDGGDKLIIERRIIAIASAVPL